MTLFYLDGMAGIDWARIGDALLRAPRARVLHVEQGARALLSGDDASLVAGELADRVVLQTSCVPRAVAAQEWLGAL